MSDDEAQVDPAAILRAIETDREQAQSALSPDARLLYATWGIAWSLGFTAFYLAFVPLSGPLLPFGIAAAIGAAALVGAIVISTVHSARRSTGSRGPSMVQGAIYGNCFPLAFTMMGLLGWRLAASGVAPEVMLSYWVAVPCLIVGVLFFAGAAIWNDKSQLVFGGWTFIVGLASIAIAPPHNLLAGAIGGVGFLVLALIQAIRPDLTSGPITRGHDG